MIVSNRSSQRMQWTWQKWTSVPGNVTIVNAKQNNFTVLEIRGSHFVQFHLNLAFHAFNMSFFTVLKKIVGINNVYDNHTTKDHFNVTLVRIIDFFDDFD